MNSKKNHVYRVGIKSFWVEKAEMIAKQKLVRIGDMKIFHKVDVDQV